MNSWDDLAKKRHEQLIKGKDITFNEILFPTIKNLIESIASYKNFYALDIGCGTGYLTNILSNFFRQIVGIEPSYKSSIIAQEYNSTELNVNIQNISLEDFAKTSKECFDFAIAHMSFHTMDNINKQIGHCSALIKEGGWLLFSIPHPCFWPIIKNEIGDSDYRYHIHSSHQNIFRFDDGARVHVPHFHHSLASYSEYLNQASLRIIVMKEPYPSNELMEKYERKWIYPGFIFFLCKKINF